MCLLFLFFFFMFRRVGPLWEGSGSLFRELGAPDYSARWCLKPNTYAKAPPFPLPGAVGMVIILQIGF